jgi:NTE family protein
MTIRALVLGGGGVTGVAWELGLLHGLAAAGIDLASADVIIGTSAGSAVAAQITSGRPLTELYEAQLRASTTEVSARMGPGTILRLAAASLGSRDQQAARAKIGRLALAARTVTPEQRLAVIAARVPSGEWPTDRRLLVTAVAADTGEFVVFDRDSGVPLIDAVAASCAVPGVWPPASINGRRYIDGGMRSPANVDLASGADRVVVVAPIGGAFRRAQGVAAQVAALASGTTAIVVMPDSAARRAIGRNVLDPARRPAAARAGLAQAASVRDRVAAVWDG